MSSKLKAGKLDPLTLGNLLQRCQAGSDRLVVPPRIGEDAAVIALPDRYLVVGTDPITFVSEDVGHYVVTINANDVAALGARPLFFSCVLLFPDGAVDTQQVQHVFEQIQQTCIEQQVAWIGGHTEVTPAVTHPLAVGQMIGEVALEGLVRKDSMQPRDSLLLTKALAVEAVSIIARMRAEQVRKAHGEAFWERAMGFVRQPGIGVTREALAACAVGGVHAMHDPTEGGLSSGLYELVEITGLGVAIQREAIPVYPEAEILCRQFGLDILGVIASGSLLIVADPARAPEIQAHLEKTGVACAMIGEVVEQPGCRFDDGTELPRFAVDEISRLLE